jgi:arylsulfatase A-like enzyme
VSFLYEKGVPSPYDLEILELNNLYDGEILFVDEQIERLLATLRQLGLYDELALVVTSDHGEGLGQHYRITHGEIYNEQLFVPLLIKFPEALGLNGRRVEGLVSLIDVVPTLVETLGLALSDEEMEQFVGINALAASNEREYVLAQRTTRERQDWGKGKKFALVGLDWKYAFSTEKGDSLFDMRANRTETVDMSGVKSELRDSLKELLFSELDRYSESGLAFEVDDEIDTEVLEELRALGYIQ